MRRWRNVVCPESEPDAEIRSIDALESALGAVEPIVERIRALISRVDPLSHYKAFENIDFVMGAIGQLDYPGSPAVDVLWRRGQIDDERRAEAKRYVFCLTAWLEGKDLAQAESERPDCSTLLQKTYTALGKMDDCKGWLAMCLRKTLKEHAYTPWDVIAEHDDEAFVCAVYESILGRPPSPDDLQFRIEELRGGKDREALLDEIMSAEEHRTGHLYGVASFLKRRGG
jgi:hypothetical protein